MFEHATLPWRPESERDSSLEPPRTPPLGRCRRSTSRGLAALFGNVSMNEKRCFVQFIHPGGEHEPDDGHVKGWNRAAHARKFLLNSGTYLDGGTLHHANLVFWGEWEPE